VFGRLGFLKDHDARRQCCELVPVNAGRTGMGEETQSVLRVVGVALVTNKSTASQESDGSLSGGGNPVQRLLQRLPGSEIANSHLWDGIPALLRLRRLDLSHLLLRL
jgi:hypothetical protein